MLAAKRDSLTFEEYTSKREERAIVEREFQTAIEACIDIGQLIIREQSVETPETNAAVFKTLGRINVLDDTLAEHMSRAAGFRNILVHQYGNAIDDRDVYNTLQTELPIFQRYLECVRDTFD